MNSIFKKIDLRLITVAFLLLFIGITAIYSTTYTYSGRQLSSFFYKQIIWVVIGILASVIVIKIGCQKIIEWSYILFFLNIILLVIVLFFGISRGGGHRWLKIGAFNLQPSEFMKLSIILVSVRFLESYRRGGFSLSKSFTLMLLLAVPVILIAHQPDLGTSLALIPVVFAIWYVSGLGLRHLRIFSCLCVAGSPLLWWVLREYQKQRLLVFIKPELDPLGAGYTVIQSKVAIGSGGILGKGWLSGTQNILNFLPERHTDFIFSVIGEEWGFLGALFVLGLYAYLIKRALDIALNANHGYDKLVATGIATLLSFHIVVNVGMTMGIMPAVGLPLPFISYGGSNLVMTIISLGFLLEINKRNIIRE